MRRPDLFLGVALCTRATALAIGTKPYLETRSVTVASPQLTPQRAWRLQSIFAPSDEPGACGLPRDGRYSSLALK